MGYLVRSIKDVKGKEIATGVMERILVSADETASKSLTLKHLVIESGCKYGPVQTGAGEALLYCISGHGNLTYRGIFAPQYFTLYEFEGDKFSLIPPARDFYIVNLGEGSLRMVHVSYKLPEMKPRGMVEIFSKDNPPRTDMVPGVISRVLLPPEVISAKGMEKFAAFESETMSPHSKAGPQTFSPNTETIAYLIRGEGKVTVDKQELRLGPGTAVYNGHPHVPRTLESTTDDVMVWLEIIGRA